MNDESMSNQRNSLSMLAVSGMVLGLVAIAAIVASVPAEGRLEATTRSRLYGFTDEVIVRVKASDSGALVDVRSRSRLGRVDHGVNAKRIRAYLAALRQRAA